MPIITQPLLETAGLPETGGMFRSGRKLINRKLLAQIIAAGGAAPAIVQNVKTHSTPASGSAPVASITPTSGRLLVVGVYCYTGLHANVTVIDNIDVTGASWIKIGGANNLVGNSCVALFYKAASPIGLTSITAACAGGTYVTSCIFEVSGAAASPFTIGESAFNSNSDTNTTNPQTGNITTATANSLIFSICGNNSNGNPVTLTINAAGGTVGTWNLYPGGNSEELDASTYGAFSMPNIAAVAAGTQSHGWTSADAYQAIGIAAFHP